VIGHYQEKPLIVAFLFLTASPAGPLWPDRNPPVLTSDSWLSE
jgi:hypothetical protein